MAVLIDTSVLISYERKQLNLEARIEGREDEEFFLSVITASELLHGVHRALDPDIRARRSAFVEGILGQFPMLDVDLATARAHSRLWADAMSEGRLIGAHDMWIAATCLARGLSIVTANRRDFERVPGLRVETWPPEAEAHPNP